MMIILVVATADSMAEWLRRRSPKPKIAGPDPQSTRLMPRLWRDRTPESHSDLAGVVTGADPRSSSIPHPDPESTRLMPELWRDRTPESHSDLAGVVTGADPRSRSTFHKSAQVWNRIRIFHDPLGLVSRWWWWSLVLDCTTTTTSLLTQQSGSGFYVSYLGPVGSGLQSRIG